MSILFETVTVRSPVHPSLRPFVSHYVFRSVHFPQEFLMNKMMPVRLQSSMDFYIGERFETVDCNTEVTVPFTRCSIRGPRTRKLYFIKLKGQFLSFSIKFKPAGLYNLTGLSMQSCTNKYLPTPNLHELPLDKITGQLLGVRDIESCIALVEPYLIHLATRHTGRCSIVDNIIIKMDLHTSGDAVSKWASACHLSVRQLERIFLKEVGLTPKTFYRLCRFEKMIRSKIEQPSVKWSALACEFGYADQMHLIKEFKQFLGITPSHFVPSDFAF